jgi:DNA-binding LacI/PurR family transcriptional regulator
MEKQAEILRTLRNEITSGEYSLGGRFPSEYELAERFAVNNKTANKAVSLLVAEGLLKRGRRGQNTTVAEALPFPKGFLLFLSGRPDNYSDKLLYGAQQGALAHGYLLVFSSPSVSELLPLMKRLPNSSVRGIITYTYGIIESQLPTMHIDQPAGGLQADQHMITCDNYRGGYEMMKEILAHGHRDIVILFHRDLMPLRLQGFQQALIEAGITDYKARTFWVNPSEYGVLSSMKSMREKYSDFTAVAAGSDNLLFSLIRVLDKLEIPWRNRIALTGFGNMESSPLAYKTATVDQHPVDAGRLAAEYLVEMIENGAPATGIREIVDVELVNISNIPILVR